MPQLFSTLTLLAEVLPTSWLHIAQFASFKLFLTEKYLSRIQISLGKGRGGRKGKKKKKNTFIKYKTEEAAGTDAFERSQVKTFHFHVKMSVKRASYIYNEQSFMAYTGMSTARKMGKRFNLPLGCSAQIPI